MATMPPGPPACQTRHNPVRRRRGVRMAWGRSAGKLLSRSRFGEPAHRLHDAVVAQARQPALYRGYGVPDTLDGRFELAVLHALLVMRRLRRIDAAGARAGERAAQALFDLTFADFDRALRELGVGDLSVGRRIRHMGRAFYGRASGLDRALDGAAPLAPFLRRNVYGTVAASDRQVAALAAYVARQEAHLATLSDGPLLAGQLAFLAVPAAPPQPASAPAQGEPRGGEARGGEP